MRTAAAALIAAAVVASCARSDPAVDDSTEISLAPLSSLTTAAPTSSVGVVGVGPRSFSDRVVGVGDRVASDDEVVDIAQEDDVVDESEIEAANPASIRIPSIQVEAAIIGLGLNEDGSIEVPENTDETGWWRGGPEPGEIGPAVILGHVDSYVGPAVFARLEELKAGDLIHVDREDATTVVYVVESSERFKKDEFPTETVYGTTEEPTLRLITCGGSFDTNDRSYVENLVVFASLG